MPTPTPTPTPTSAASSSTPSQLRSAAATTWLYIFAGLSASLVGIGLARFAYTPLIPPLIQAHWFSAPDVVYLGAANLAGYLVGALLGRPMAARISNRHTLRLMMLAVTLAFLACAFPISVAWFFGWRFLSGVAGGAIMVLVAATLLPHIPGERKGLAAGAIFTGLGIGIAGSGTVVPLLLSLGLRETWIGLGLLSGLFTAASWFAWPSAGVEVSPALPSVGAGSVSASAATTATTIAAPPHDGFALNALYVEYALMAVGIVPAMVFLVDFIARGLGAGAHFGSFFWVIYGVGALFGPPLYGFLVDRMGGRTSLRLILLIQAAAIGVMYLSDSQIVIGFVTFLIGTFPPGVPPLVLSRVRELAPGEISKQNVIWSRATVVFALFQALAGYGCSAIFNASGGNHRLLFLIATVALGIAWLIDHGTSFRFGAKSKNRESQI